MEYIRKFLVLVLIIPVLFTAAGSAAETAKKVAILPFEINAPEDLSYLREGIMDMLASRIRGHRGAAGKRCSVGARGSAE
jgi:hypothetical protein